MYHSAFMPGTTPAAAAVAGGPLAPDLYAALCKRFGRVDVHKRGELATYRVVAGYSGGETQFTSLGELYYFNCPFCGDKRRRGWCSHMYGQADPASGRIFSSLVGCWNEDCFREPLRYFDFSQILAGGMAVVSFAPIDPGRGHAPARPAEARLPEGVARLDQLTAQHPAVRYVAERGFDPAEIGRGYGVCYCADGDLAGLPIISNRLVIPVVMHGRLVGWQARRLGGRAKLKYYTMEGFSTGQAIYGWDAMAAESVRRVVLVEGVVDAWAAGPGAGALFGKDVKDGQLCLLHAKVPHEAEIVLLLDPGAGVEKAKAMLATAFPGRVFVARCPEQPAREDCRVWPVEKVDPGVLTRDAIWRIVAAAVRGDADGNGV